MLFREPTPDIAPHLIDTPEASPVRPIASREGEALSALYLPLSDAQYRARVDELYRVVVDDRKRPEFAPNDPVEPIYNAAIAILNKYMKNAWHEQATLNELSAVHSMHDYLVTSVKYDFELYEQFKAGGKVDNDPAFDIDGVFLHSRAVCDGLSSAFTFLCSIEGIESMRVTGTYAGVQHAWNKVRVAGTWYNIDVTADAANYVVNNSEYKTQLSHGYFLLSDKTYQTFRPRYHVFEPTVPAEVDFDFYADSTFTVNGNNYPCVIKSAETLNKLFADINASKNSVGKLEVKLDFPGKININDADMYKTEIDAAYTRLFNPDFSTENQRPYFQSPNGVYLFLMYQ